MIEEQRPFITTDMQLTRNSFYRLAVAGSALLTLAASAYADVGLPALISDHMVLQAGEPVRIWGWAQPDEQVTVEAGGQKLATHADKDGQWSVEMAPFKAGEQLTLKVTGHNQMVIRDVLAGEVWLGSGQSNMRLPVNRANHLAEEESAANHPEIRMFTVVTNFSPTPLEDCRGQWQVCSPKTVVDFSAILYFFGRDLQEQLRVPVGLIHSSWGGTPIQPWISLRTLKDYPGYPAILERKKKEAATWPARKKQFEEQLEDWKKAVAEARAQHKPEPKKPRNPAPPDAGQYMPCELYNAMIHPLIRYRIRGAVWYQGEANADFGQKGAAAYTDLLSRLIGDWRQDWGVGEFPFLAVQLPNWENPNESSHESWAWFREGQANALKSVPGTGMAVTIDIGEADNLHPKNKQEAGRRVSLIALNQVYHKPVVCFGPRLSKATTGGNEVKIYFTDTDGGLMCHGSELHGFVVAGKDKFWHSATAKIEGDAVVVSSAEVPKPIFVRYGWANNPDGNLYNGAGLPAMPFRTDD